MERLNKRRGNSTFKSHLLTSVVTSRSPFSVDEIELLKSINDYVDEVNIHNYQSFSVYSKWYIQFLRHEVCQYVSSEANSALLARLYGAGQVYTNNPSETGKTIPYIESIFQSLGTVVSVLRLKDSSISSIADALGEMKNALRDPSMESACCHHIFTLVSWLTVLYVPSPSQPTHMLRLALPDSTNPKKSLRSDTWRALACVINGDVISQPFPTVLYNFGDLVPKRLDNRKRGLKQAFLDDSIIASNLSYLAVSKVGYVRVEWVKAISLHLEFDERTSVLKLFQYPSYCAMLGLGRDSNSTMFSHIFGFTTGDSDDSSSLRSFENNDLVKNTTSFCQDYFVEVLYSYRLLFGQDKHSTKELQKIFSSIQAGSFDDPLLYQLCATSIDEGSMLEEFDALRIKSLYSARSDFPFLGKRILVLQEFIASQNPSDFKSLWYDRRDILRFYTFWAVLVLGGVSTLLSLIQIILGALQVAQAYKGGSN